MIKLYIDETIESPAVVIDEELGLVEIKGNSTMENPVSFYQNLFNHLAKFLEEKEKELDINFRLVYFNTSSSKWIFQMLKILEGAYKNGKNINIKWICEEDDEVMLEAGEDYHSLLKMPFHIIEE